MSYINVEIQLRKFVLPCPNLLNLPCPALPYRFLPYRALVGLDLPYRILTCYAWFWCALPYFV